MKLLHNVICLCFCFICIFGQKCDDLDSDVCKRLHGQNPSLCADSCLSSICTRFCGQCPLTCYSCHEVDDPSNCTTTAVCPSKDHHCFTTQTYTDDFQEVYKLGCAKKSLCEQNINSGKRSHLDVNGGCCTFDKCNNKLPALIDELTVTSTTEMAQNTTASPSILKECKNFDDDICLRISMIDPSFCTNDCISSQICPRTCRKCFQCYQCNDINSPGDCNTTTTCESGKECFRLQTLSFDLRPVFRLGCLEENLCSRFNMDPLQSAFGRRDVSLIGGCCKTDLCNIQRTLPTTQTTTQRASPVTTGTPTCRPMLIGDCPIGFVRRADSCYYISRSHRIQSAAHEECASYCTRLVIISSEVENKEITDFLHQSKQIVGINEESRYWIDAYRSDSNFDGTWVWNSTGTIINDHTYSHWRPGSHINYNADGEHCADIGRGESSNIETTNGYFWDHGSCLHRLLPLCEYPLGKSP